MDNWLKPALDYIPKWLEYQMRETEQPGCVIAIVHKGRVVLEQAFGCADITNRTPLTPRHRFRVASHSKSFTAAGIMKLREVGKLGLDDRIGRHVDGLHPAVAEATIAQLLSHSAGIVRGQLPRHTYDRWASDRWASDSLAGNGQARHFERVGWPRVCIGRDINLVIPDRAFRSRRWGRN